MTNDTQSLEPGKPSLVTVPGDGGPAAVKPEEVTRWKEEAGRIAKSGRYLVTSRRWMAERTRFCLWDGQSPDGRKHAESNNGIPAFPFEGACDARVRLADMIVNERVLVLAAAALRNLPRVKALDAANEPLGTKLTVLLKWVLQNKLGSAYLREIVKLAQYQEGDSPAGAVAGVWWEEEWALEMRNLNLQEIGAMLSAPPAQGGFGLTPAQVNQLDAQLQNPDRDDETAQLLQQLLPLLSDSRAKKVVKELRAEGTADFPSPYKRLDQPCFRAYRLYEDIFFPANTTDVRSQARFLLVREWLSEVALKERVVSQGYSEEFVEKVMTFMGQSAFPEYERHEVTGEWTPVSMTEMQELHYGEYEILTTVFRAVNEDYVPGIYYLPFSYFVEDAAADRQVLNYAHGEYPFTGFFREILSNRVLDSRGVPELVASEQTALKLLRDSYNDNVSLATLPPIKVPRRRGKLSLVYKPLGLIKEDRPGEINFMAPPQYPQGNEQQQKLIKAFVDEYFGRISAELPPLLTQLHQQGLVQNFLASLSDALKQLLQLCQQYMTDAELAKITGDDGLPIAHDRAEVQGDFMVECSFDPRDLDLNYFKEVAALVVQILGLDTLNVTMRDKVVRWMFSCISPSLAVDFVRPAEAAQQSEIQDEELNFTKCAAGIEPPMVPEGLNFPLRLQVWTGIPQKNPDAYRSLTPTSQKIYQARLQYLQNQVQQQRNAQIGRQVGQPALGRQPGPGAANPAGSGGMDAGLSAGPAGNVVPMGGGQ